MTVSNVFADAAAGRLQSSIRGRVVVPDDPTYDQGRGGWNLAAEQRPRQRLRAGRRRAYHRRPVRTSRRRC